MFATHPGLATRLSYRLMQPLSLPLGVSSAMYDDLYPEEVMAGIVKLFRAVPTSPTVEYFVIFETSYNPFLKENSQAQPFVATEFCLATNAARTCLQRPTTHFTNRARELHPLLRAPPRCQRHALPIAPPLCLRFLVRPLHHTLQGRAGTSTPSVSP